MQGKNFYSFFGIFDPLLLCKHVVFCVYISYIVSGLLLSDVQTRPSIGAGYNSDTMEFKFVYNLRPRIPFAGTSFFYSIPFATILFSHAGDPAVRPRGARSEMSAENKFGKELSKFVLKIM